MTKLGVLQAGMLGRQEATQYWPRHLPRTFAAPTNTLAENLAIAAIRYGSRPGIAYFGRDICYAEWLDQSTRLAGWLQARARVQRGDRVVLFMQNCPQWLIACFGVLRADAVVVPVSPMFGREELRSILLDCGAKAIVCAQPLAETAVAAAAQSDVRCILSTSYGDFLPEAAEFELPDWIRQRSAPPSGCENLVEVLRLNHLPDPAQATANDVALLPYTSGSTGVPKGCVHTHASFMHTAQGGAYWYGVVAGTSMLGLAPMYHVSGLSQAVNVPLTAGATIVVQPRWDASLAARLIARYRVRHAAIAPTAIIDLLDREEHVRHDLSSLRVVAFGGAPMPEEVFNRLHSALGVDFIEGWGMTETAAAAIVNPLCRPKRQCLGVPFFNTRVMIVDPETLQPRDPSESGEILVTGPQLFQGYWQRPEDTKKAIVELDGVRFLRTGDVGYCDHEGYYFMSDRLKRMINASGFKVWPAEVENKLYEHPDVAEACVIRTADAYRGETVKALVVLKRGRLGHVTPEQIVQWSRERMAAYKYPRIVEFLDELPKSLNGKILWRELQQREDAVATSAHSTLSQP